MRVRVAAVACAVLEILPFGGTQVVRGVTIPPVLLPWHWLAHLPVVSQMLPDRLSILADGLAAVVLAVALDLTLSAAQQPRWRRPGSPAGAGGHRGPAGDPAAHAHHPGGHPPLRVPGGLTRLALPRDARVLVVPVPFGHVSAPLRWYAETGYPGSANGGYFIGPNRNGLAMGYGGRGPQAIAKSLDSLWHPSSRAAGPSTAQLRRWVRR